MWAQPKSPRPRNTVLYVGFLSEQISQAVSVVARNSCRIDVLMENEGIEVPFLQPASLGTNCRMQFGLQAIFGAILLSITHALQHCLQLPFVELIYIDDRAFTFQYCHLECERSRGIVDWVHALQKSRIRTDTNPSNQEHVLI